MNRVKHMSYEDLLWEAYLHTLAGFHGNWGANNGSNKQIAEHALGAAKAAVRVWKEDQP